MAFYKLGTREGGVNPTGNAVEANVLKNKTFSNASGINKIGTMPDNSTTTSNGTVPGINSSYPNVPIRPGSNVQMGVNTDGVKQLAIEPPQGYYPGGGSSYIGVDADDLGDAVASDVVSGKTFTSESGIEVVGTMPNNGAVSPTALSPNGSYIIPLGYHNGNGVVSASPNTGTYSPTTRNAALDMGIDNLNRYVDTTGVPNSNTETYVASSRGASLDMGATNNYRYVNTNGVPNSNSGTYTFASGDTGGTKDLGETNTYRYVNATNVYNKGKTDGQASGSLGSVYVQLNALSNQIISMKTGQIYSIPYGSSANLEDGIIGYANGYATGFNVNYAECTGQIGVFNYHTANELSGGDNKHVAKLYDGTDFFVDVIGKNANHLAYSYRDGIIYKVPAGSTITTKSGVSITRGTSGYAWTCNKKVIMFDFNSSTVSNISAGQPITASGENILFSVLK